MDTNIKNKIGYVIIFTLLVGTISTLWYVHAFSRSIEPSSFRSFSVSGEGKAVVIPDVAEFTFQVITEGDADLIEIQRINTQKTNTAVTFIKSMGVDDKDIKTQSYDVEPRYQYFNCGIVSRAGESKPCPPPEIAGYTVRVAVRVKVRDFEKIGSLLSGIVDNGANSVSGIQFTVDDQTGVENIARAEAIAKAREKAEAIAEAGRFRLGRLLSIQEGGASPLYQRAYAEEYGVDTAKAPLSAIVIEPGSQDIKIIMTLVFEIK